MMLQLSSPAATPNRMNQLVKVWDYVIPDVQFIENEIGMWSDANNCIMQGNVWLQLWVLNSVCAAVDWGGICQLPISQAAALLRRGINSLRAGIFGRAACREWGHTGVSLLVHERKLTGFNPEVGSFATWTTASWTFINFRMTNFLTNKQEKSLLGCKGGGKNNQVCVSCWVFLDWNWDFRDGSMLLKISEVTRCNSLCE